MTEVSENVLNLFREGGLVMWALLGISILAAAVAIERFAVLRRARTDTAPFLAELRRRAVVRGSISEAIRLCEQTRGPLAAIVKAALLRWDSGREEMERGVEAAARYELKRLERRIGILAMIANVAPLLGFLGTVTGMIVSFGALEDFGATNPGLVAGGIREALLTTAAGLTVAIPTQVAHAALRGRVAALVGDFETATDLLADWAALALEETGAEDQV